MFKKLSLALFALVALSAAAMAQPFPVTVTHMFGTTTIPAQPQRVVSIGMHEQDFLYALGVAPVGVREWWGDYPYATWPWAEAARKAVGAEPAVTSGDPLNFEWVLDQNPDLIIAIYTDLDADTYARLSKIAPTVASPEGYALWSAPWQAELTLIDKATSGTTTKSDTIIADFAKRFAETRAKYPQLQGKSGTNVYYDPSSGFTAWSSNDLASKFLIDLGLTIPPELDAMAQADNRINISPENMRLLDMDVVVWPIEDSATGLQQSIEAMPLYQNLRLAKQGRSVWMDDGKGQASAAMSFQTPLSLGYLLDTLPPALAAAVDGDPATPADFPKK